MPKFLINCLVVAAAGALGAVARYVIAVWFNTSAYPWGTLFVNLLGSFVLGLFMAAFGDKAGPQNIWRLAVAVGFIGTFTTFSSWMYESDKMMSQDAWLRAAGYLAGSVFFGLLAVRLGIMVGDRL